jgi:hypothetical protein
VTAIAVATVGSVGIALLIDQVFSPGSTVPRLGYMFEDWALFLGLLVVYTVAILTSLRVIVQAKVADRYFIATELSTCFVAWVFMAGGYFVYLIVILADQEGTGAKSLDFTVFPSEIFLLVMFLWTLYESVAIPFVFTRRGMLGYLRATCCSSARGQEPKTRDSDSLNDVELLVDNDERRRFDSALENGQNAIVAPGSSQDEQHATAQLLHMLGIMPQPLPVESMSSEEIATVEGSLAKSPRGVLDPEMEDCKGGSERDPIHELVKSHVSQRTRLRRASGRSSVGMSRQAVECSLAFDVFSARLRPAGTTRSFGQDEARLWAAIVDVPGVSFTTVEEGLIQKVDVKDLRKLWPLPSLMRSPPAFILLRRFAQKLLCPETVDFLAVVLEHRLVIAAVVRGIRRGLAKLADCTTTGLTPGAGMSPSKLTSPAAGNLKQLSASPPLLPATSSTVADRLRSRTDVVRDAMQPPLKAELSPVKEEEEEEGKTSGASTEVKPGPESQESRLPSAMALAEVAGGGSATSLRLQVVTKAPLILPRPYCVVIQPPTTAMAPAIIMEPALQELLQRKVSPLPPPGNEGGDRAASVRFSAAAMAERAPVAEQPEYEDERCECIQVTDADVRSLEELLGDHAGSSTWASHWTEVGSQVELREQALCTVVTNLYGAHDASEHRFMQWSTQHGLVLVDSKPIISFAEMVFDLFIRTGSQCEINISDAERRKTYHALRESLHMDKDLKLPVRYAFRRAPSFLAVLPTTSRLRGFSSHDSAESVRELVSFARLEALACIFDSAIIETVRGASVYLYPPFMRSHEAKRLAAFLAAEM